MCVLAAPPLYVQLYQFVEFSNYLTSNQFYISPHYKTISRFDREEEKQKAAMEVEMGGERKCVPKHLLFGCILSVLFLCC